MNSAGDPIAAGLRSWLDGDLETLHELLDRDVTLEWTQAGGMDRVGRQQVMETLHRGRDNATEPAQLERLSDDVVLVAQLGNDSNNLPIVTRSP